MLKSIKIKNFKSVQDLEIDLGRINVFIGENGCGKTSILEAIGMGCTAFSNQLNQSTLFSRGIRVTDDNLMRSAFTKGKNSDFINIKLTNHKGNFLDYYIAVLRRAFDINHTRSNMDEDIQREKLYGRLIEVIRNDDTLLKQITDRLGENALEEKLIDEIELVLNPGKSSPQFLAEQPYFHKNRKKQLAEFKLENFMIYTPEDHFLRQFEESGQVLPLGKQGQGLFKHLVELFKRNKDFAEKIKEQLKLISWFDGLQVPSDLAFTEMRLNIQDRYIKDNIAYFDQNSANEGFLYLLFYFTLFLSDETPPFFAIDNIDNALNPRLGRELIERLTRLAVEKKKQVIFTTHNPAILDGLNLKDNDQRLFVVYRNADGHTKVKRVNPPKPIEGIETVRLSEAFIRGYIGGLPKNF